MPVSIIRYTDFAPVLNFCRKISAPGSVNIKTTSLVRHMFERAAGKTPSNNATLHNDIWLMSRIWRSSNQERNETERCAQIETEQLVHWYVYAQRHVNSNAFENHSCVVSDGQRWKQSFKRILEEGYPVLKEDDEVTISIDFKKMDCPELEERLAQAKPNEDGFIEFGRDEAERIGATNKYRVSCRTFVEAEGTYFFDQS